MALCPKCYIQGLVSGSGMTTADSTQVVAQIWPQVGSDGGTDLREVTFVARDETEALRDSNPFTDSAVLQGRLTGRFSPDPAEEVETDASLETFARDGALLYAQLVVRNESGRSTFSATLNPWPGAPAGAEGIPLRGTVLFGWPGEDRE